MLGMVVGWLAAGSVSSGCAVALTPTGLAGTPLVSGRAVPVGSIVAVAVALFANSRGGALDEVCGTLGSWLVPRPENSHTSSTTHQMADAAETAERAVIWKRFLRQSTQMPSGGSTISSSHISHSFSYSAPEGCSSSGS